MSYFLSFVKLFAVLAFITLIKMTFKICIQCFILKFPLHEESFLFANSSHFGFELKVVCKSQDSMWKKKKKPKQSCATISMITIFCWDIIKNMSMKRKHILETNEAHPKCKCPALPCTPVENEHPSEVQGLWQLETVSCSWIIMANLYNLTTESFCDTAAILITASNISDFPRNSM